MQAVAIAIQRGEIPPIALEDAPSERPPALPGGSAPGDQPIPPCG